MGRGVPSPITVDNGTEIFSKTPDANAYHRRVELDFIRPGHPMEWGRVERFKGRDAPRRVPECRAIF